MRNLRLFIAITIPNTTREQITNKFTPVSVNLPASARFAKPDSWHLTITFLGYQPEQELSNILAAVCKTVACAAAPKIHLTNFCYGPLAANHASLVRMIWVSGDTETSNTLGALKQILKSRLADHNIMFRRENRPYHCHLTICRFNQASLRSLPPLNANTDINFIAPSLHLVESSLSNTGAKYLFLDSFAFKTGM